MPLDPSLEHALRGSLKQDLELRAGGPPR